MTTSAAVPSPKLTPIFLPMVIVVPLADSRAGVLALIDDQPVVAEYRGAVEDDQRLRGHAAEVVLAAGGDRAGGLEHLLDAQGRHLVRRVDQEPELVASVPQDDDA